MANEDSCCGREDDAQRVVLPHLVSRGVLTRLADLHVRVMGQMRSKAKALRVMLRPALFAGRPTAANGYELTRADHRAVRRPTLVLARNAVKLPSEALKTCCVFRAR